MCKSHDGNAKKGKSILKFNQDKSLKGLHSLSMPTQNHCFKKLMHEIKISKHRACGYSIFTHFLLDSSKSKRDFYRSAN